MVWYLQHNRSLIFSPVAEKTADQMVWCLQHNRSLIFSPVAEKADQMVRCLQHSGSLISALLQRKQQIKWFGVNSTVKVLSSVLLQIRWQIKWFGVYSTAEVFSPVADKVADQTVWCLQTAEVISESSCREGDIWNGCVCAAQWRSDLSPLHRP